MRATFTLLDIRFQLVPAGMHRFNTAERMIQTFKCHFITCLVSVDPNFPMHLWEKLVDQTEETINMLRQYIINPHLSEYDALNGTFSFNKTTLAPPGTRVVIENKTETKEATIQQEHTGGT